jgi:hypothetical protein
MARSLLLLDPDVLRGVRGSIGAAGGGQAGVEGRASDGWVGIQSEGRSKRQ